MVERLADMKELPRIEYDDYNNYDPYDYNLKEKQSEEESKKEVQKLNIEKDYNEKDLKLLEKYSYPRPMNLYKYDNQAIDNYFGILKYKIKQLSGLINGRSNKEDADANYITETENLKYEKDTLKKYSKTIKDYLTSRDYVVGEGIRSSLYLSPQELLKRLKLLSGSLAAGNNGIIPEYIQIAHRLGDLGVFTNKQLNTLLRNYVDIR